MPEIKCTKDYFIFKKHHSNRDIDQNNLKRIKGSLQVKNLMQFKPILVDNEMRILDGQHRLEAAKQLGIDVYYQVDEKSNAEEIILINANQKKWRKEDYLNYYISMGNIEYLKVKEFCEKQGLPLADFLRMQNIQSRIQGAKIDKFEMGTYKFPEDEQAKEHEKVLEGLRLVLGKLDSFLIRDKKFIKGVYFKRAIMEFLRNPEVNLQIFLNKLGYKVESMHGCADPAGYVAMFRDIYNWRNANPIEI